jgi:type I restriction-modification system DNA methylase subunit
MLNLSIDRHSNQKTFPMSVLCDDMNERNTENIVRDILKENKKKYSKVTIEEQKSHNPRIEKLLKNASKQGHGVGKPEFIITFDEMNDFVIVIECKADVQKHRSKELNNFKDYAVDGVLLYSSYLSKEFNVIAIAVSGEQKSNLKISNFLQLSGKNYEELVDKQILEFEDYLKSYKKNPEKEKLDIAKLMKYSKKLHNDLRDFAKLSEPEKPLLISAILIALNDDSFISSYRKKSKSSDLAKLLISTIKENLEHASIPDLKIKHMMQPYSFITVHPELTKDYDNKGQPVSLLYDLINEIEENVHPFLSDYVYYDIIGQFYGEFLRYTGGDKKGLGIVLTPRHITELFAEIADVKKDDVVLDNCCGTGGFLISAMDRMIKDADNDKKTIKKIKEENLIGIEPNSNMFALACANMILRGDGKANIYHDNCFSLTEIIRKTHKNNIGFLNPPYSQKGEGLSELDFVEQCLNCLEKNGTCIAIVPITCATAPSPQKERLLKNHTLDAVMSMPVELFGKAGAVTCIMVFKAKIPHSSNKDTWFGYWRDDGFVKTKHEGRIDKFQKWDGIKKKWLENYFKRKEIIGESILHNVTSNDEWVAEAYMKTNYSEVTEKDFINSLKEYTIFKIRTADFLVK